MTVKKILDRYYEGLSTDPKPTGVIPMSYFRETDTYFLYKTFDGDTWVTIDWGLLGNVAVLQHHIHSRMRVYPQDVSATIALAPTAVANTFGDWTEAIPINTIDFMYMVIGLVIEVANAATTFLVQMGYSIVDGIEPTTAQILGERRFLLPSPINKATEVLGIHAAHCPANAKLWGRLKTASGTAQGLEISVAIIRHQEVTNPITHLETWPWST